MAAAESLFRPRNVWEDIASLFLRPSALFLGLAVENRAGRALGILLILEMALTGLIVSTGVVDYEIEADTQRQVSERLRDQEGPDDDDALASTLSSIEKWGVFKKLLAKLGWVLGIPGRTLAGVIVLSWILFAAVALRGGKPKYEELLAVAVFASFVELPRLLVKLYLITELQVARVETSLAAFVPVGPKTPFWIYLLARRIDPFEIWFWILVGYGIWKIGALRAKSAVILVMISAAIFGLAASGLDLLELAKPPEYEPGPTGPKGRL